MAFSLSACAARNTWQGEYSYEALLGENVAEDAVIIEYTLNISDTACSIRVEGYQVAESILCTAVTSKDSLEVKFLSYKNGSIRNVYDVAVYPVGSLLFSLVMDDEQLVTTWGELLPDESLKRRGFYFIKQ
jgi:hypothetical protein